MNDIHINTFREEAHELLSDLEFCLLELEEKPTDTELIGRAFRAMHTIKGSGSMFGFDEIAGFTHEIETVFDLVRNGEIPVTKELIDLTLKARDCILSMLDSSSDMSIDDSLANQVLSAFRSLSSTKNVSQGDAGPVEAPASRQKCEPMSYRIHFRPSEDMFRSGTNPIPLLKELQELGSCSVVAQLDSIPPLEECNTELCYTSWDVILTTDKDVNMIKDVFIFVEDSCELTIDPINISQMTDGEDSHRRLGEILVGRGEIKSEDLQKALNQQKRIGEILVDKGFVSPDKVETALAEQKHVNELQEKQKIEQSVATIRVAADKLDKLVDLVGELVTVQARLTQKSNTGSDSELLLISEEVERLTEELRDNTMSIRMVPIGTTFNKFRRLVRDLSNSLQKEIELSTEGAETELDKTVIEQLNDPLVHIIRNSIDHGIESPDEREAVGKPREGMLHLSAKHSGANVLVEITDDGNGLDSELIRSKAVERGIIQSDTELSEKEIFNLIFEPGFSTAKKVTGVSGRGVGMDVVKRTIDTLRGSVEIMSEKGTGTTITLKLPLTLSIIEGLLVSIGPNFFVLPLSSVEECLQLTHEDITRNHGRHIANVRGEIVPYIRLREKFRIYDHVPDIEQIVITDVDRTRVGFVVDSVIGQYQTVIKSLGRVYRDVDGVSGATILGDGSVALIVDLNHLMHSVERTEMDEVRNLYSSENNRFAIEQNNLRRN